MKTKILYLSDEKLDEIALEVATVLKKGWLAIIPTDTIYGIIALDGLNEAVNRIYQIKNRPRDKKLIRLIGSLKSLKRFTNQYPDKLIEKYWPGPLTIVFKGIDSETVALRYPDNPLLRNIFKYLNYRAIVAPSANISGKNNLLSCEDIIKEFKGKVDLIVCKRGVVKAKPSTIVDVTDEKKWKVLRNGELKIKL